MSFHPHKNTIISKTMHQLKDVPDSSEPINPTQHSLKESHREIISTAISNYLKLFLNTSNSTILSNNLHYFF